MTQTIEQRLARLHNRRTAYELVAKRGAETYLVQYCQGQARNNLLRAACKRGLALERLTGTDTLTFATKAADGGTMGDWAIVWSGRTEREAICRGEHQFLEIAE